GVSDRPGTLEVAGTEHPGNWSLISEGPLRFTVALTTLDDYFATHPVERVDAIKMDIEGVEPRAIQGGRATIARHRPLIAFEANPSFLLRMGSGIDELLDLIESLDYRVYDQPTRRAGLLRPVHDRAELQAVDMTNLVAVPSERCRGAGAAEPLKIANLVRD
ncbi:MAG: FkbM family methyltransferase, partial [Singulisphaera sp.]